jgi:hypothetical protein
MHVAGRGIEAVEFAVVPHTAVADQRAAVSLAFAEQAQRGDGGAGESVATSS